MEPVNSPVPPGVKAMGMKANTVVAVDTLQSETLDLGDGITVRTSPLIHPNNASGYRVEFEGKSICYITDTEHPGEGNDPVLVEFLRDSDVVIYDASYSDEEYKTRIGWGHSTWEAGVRLCDEANAKTYVVFHHDPEHDDDFMDGVARDVEVARPGSIVAREGMVIEP